jgi:hypothetical protein
VLDRQGMPASLTRRDLLAGGARLAAGAALAAPALGLLAAPGVARAADGAAGLTEAGYWAFVDPIAERMDHLWDAGDRCYGVGGEAESAINAALLTIHAVAALRDHRGAARADVRGRALAGRLCESPPWSERAHATRPDKMFHVGGWLASVRSAGAGMEKSVDPKVAEGLACAWRARDVLGIEATEAQRMASLVQRCAHGAFFRYPNVRLNQINWNSEVFAHAATMTGDTSLLRRDYYLHMRRFVAGVHRPWMADRHVRPYYGGSTNLGAGYRFNNLTTRPPGDAFNLDSAEYANITVHFLLWYARARAAGMPALPRGDHDVLTAWVERVLLGYWTHSGFLNWDSGLGLKRWQIGKTLAFAQQGLLAIARADDFHARPEFGAWAKFFFDRGLGLYTRWADEEGGGTLAPAWLNGVHAEVGGGDASKILFGARMAANAARAIDLGLGEQAAQQPPPVYAYDPDIGRLAVSTPSYSTAASCAMWPIASPTRAMPTRRRSSASTPVAPWPRPTSASSRCTASAPSTSRARGPCRRPGARAAASTCSSRRGRARHRSTRSCATARASRSAAGRSRSRGWPGFTCAASAAATWSWSATARPCTRPRARWPPQPSATSRVPDPRWRCASCAPRAFAGARSPRASRPPATPTRPPAWRRRWARADHLVPSQQAQSTLAADDEDAPDRDGQVAGGRELGQDEEAHEDRQPVEHRAQCCAPSALACRRRRGDVRRVRERELRLRGGVSAR